MIIFYCNNIADPTPILDEEEFVHCIKVLRRKEGDIICITNGQGTFAQAEIIHIKKQKAELKILSSEEQQASVHKIHLAVAPPKNRNRIEMILEKCVEIGVDAIYPYYSANSERSKMNMARAEKIMRSAAMQSQRVIHPKIYDPLKFDKLLSQFEDPSLNKFIASFDEHNPMLIQTELNNSAVILIGPEGDFDPEEISLAQSQGFQSVNLSYNRLRTETAAMVAVDILYQKIKI